MYSQLLPLLTVCLLGQRAAASPLGPANGSSLALPSNTAALGDKTHDDLVHRRYYERIAAGVKALEDKWKPKKIKVHTIRREHERDLFPELDWLLTYIGADLVGEPRHLFTQNYEYDAKSDWFLGQFPGTYPSNPEVDYKAFENPKIKVAEAARKAQELYDAPGSPAQQFAGFNRYIFLVQDASAGGEGLYSFCIGFQKGTMARTIGTIYVGSATGRTFLNMSEGGPCSGFGLGGNLTRGMGSS